MILRYLVISLAVSGMIPAFAFEPVKTNCSGEFTVYSDMICQLENIRDFFTFSMDKQQVVIQQNSQIEKLLIQQNKLQAYTFCGQSFNMNMPAKYLGFVTFDECVQRVMDDTK